MRNETKRITKIITLFMMIEFTLYPPMLLLAEDYPAGYLGSGYREYLSGKIQNGYYVEVFTKMDMRQKERVNKRNQVEEILNFSSQATPESSYEILVHQAERKENEDTLKEEATLQKQEREQVAATQTEFYYIKYSDGKVVYFQDGLATSIYNERVVDEFGNVSIKNTYNMKYNDKRLLINYQASLKDNLGNISYLHWYGATYSEDSVFYADDETSANKNLTEYYLEEVDSAGNVKLTHWQALSYEGKLLRAFTQTIEDSIYGTASFTRSNITYENNDPKHISSYHEEGFGTDHLAYTLDRTNITYNDKDQVTGYHEEIFTTQLDGTKTKTIVDAQLKYLDVPDQFGADVEEPDPNKLLETIITTTTENPDGSYNIDTTTVTYNYDENNQLIGASGHSEFNGQEADWYEFIDAEGHLLSKKEDADGNFSYSYIDPDTLETVIVPEDEVTATLKDGNTYMGVSDAQYEILGGKPMAKQVHTLTAYYNTEGGTLLKIEDATLTYNNGLVNNLQKVLGSQEHTVVTQPSLDPENNYPETRDINTTYFYDGKGNLTDAQGTGEGGGWEYQSEKGWYGKYTSKITIDYVVILGKALRKIYQEDRDYE